MNEGQIQGRLSWLGFALAARRSDITGILLRLRDIGARAGTSLSLHRKFMRLMNQVADDREKERKVIHEIEAVEKRHRELKRFNLLKRADLEAAPKIKAKPDSVFEDGDEDEDEDKKERGWFRLLWFLLLFYFFWPRPAKQKNLGPTVN